MLRRLQVLLVLAAFPAAVGVVLWVRGEGAIALSAAVYAVATAGVAALFFRTPGDVRAIARAAAERERGLTARRAELQAHVDVLTAEREISLVLNEDVDFRAILDRVLTITCDTLGGDAEIWMGRDGQLALRASRSGGKTAFDLAARCDREVRRCFDEGRVMFEAGPGRLSGLAPLQSDREIMGVVRILLPAEANAGLREERARVLSKHLPELSKFLALAVKTPDLYTRAVQDGLTGLWTKRHFVSQARAEIDAARRYGDPLSLIMVDVDHFKKVNDTHGHVTGDKVLKGVAEVLKKRVRGGSVYRYGGEEMAVLLPKVDLPRAAEVAERLREAIETRKIAGVKVTASFGVAQLDGRMAESAALVERADAALYRAKEAGRNRVVAAPDAPAGSPTSRRWSRSA
jgi:diguanylate cyclase (GGDEF)-like protein